jgi:hypothetical protein
MKLLATLAYGAAGLAALSVLVRALGEGPGRATAATAFVGVFLVVGAQMAWSLRPFLVRPDAREVVFFTREKEGGLVRELTRALARVTDGAPRPVQRNVERAGEEPPR